MTPGKTAHPIVFLRLYIVIYRVYGCTLRRVSDHLQKELPFQFDSLIARGVDAVSVRRWHQQRGQVRPSRMDLSGSPMNCLRKQDRQR